MRDQHVDSRLAHLEGDALQVREDLQILVDRIAVSHGTTIPAILMSAQTHLAQAARKIGQAREIHEHSEPRLKVHRAA